MERKQKEVNKTTETDEERIKAMVNRANGFSKKGKNNAALQALNEAWDLTEYLPAGRAEELKGLICHYQGRVEQAMGHYKEAVQQLQYAAGWRKNNTIEYAYTMFQLFICKIYGKLAITDEEVEETKRALFAAMANSAVSIEDIGNMLQNLAYIEQVKGSVEKAVVFYKMTLVVREEAEDPRGYALTQARLAECYKALGKDTEARKYGESALEYFTKTRDTERIKQVESVLMFSVIFTGRCLISSWLKFAQRG